MNLSLVDLTADPYTIVGDGEQTIDFTLPPAVQQALLAWDAPEQPCAECGTDIGHIEGEADYRWRGCFVTTDPTVRFWCEDCAENLPT